MKNLRNALLGMGAVLIVAGFLFGGFLGVIAFLWALVCLYTGLRCKTVKRRRPRPVPVVPPEKCDIPVPNSAYQQRIEKLQMLEQQADRRLQSLTEYLDQLFADSTITKNRYAAIVNEAENVTDANLRKAQDAVRIFSGSPVTAQRLEILDTYVQSSEAMISKIDDVITELIRSEQSYQKRSDQVVEEKMTELQETTKYYAQS